MRTIARHTPPARREATSARRPLLFLGLLVAVLGLLVPTSASAAPRATADNTVVATFNVITHTQWGQNVYVVGDSTALGSWNLDRAVPLSSASYPEWSGTVVLPASKPLEFKYVIKQHGQPVRWEQGPNRTTVTPPTGTYTTHDNFRC